MLARIKQAKGIKKDKEIAPLLGLSPQDFSNRKKRDTLRAPIVEWAAKEGISVSWLLTGQGDMRPEAIHKAPEGYTAAKETAEDWRKAGALPSEYEMSVLDMLRMIGPKERRRISRFITNAYTDEVEGINPTE